MGKALVVIAVAAAIGCGRARFDFVLDARLDAIDVDVTACQADGWTRVTPAPDSHKLLGVAGNSASEIWAAGNQGTLLHYDGATWTPVTSGTTVTLYSVWESSAGNAWVSTDLGALLEWNGTSFDSKVSGTGPDIDAIFGFDNGDVVAVGGVAIGRAAFHIESNNSGGVGGAPAKLYGVWGAGENAIWAVGENGALAEALFINGSFTSQPSPTTRTLYAVAGVAANEIWAVGAAGQLMHYDGSMWTASVVPALTADLRAVWGAASNDFWAVGTAGTIVHWDGSQWAASTSCATEDLFAIWGSAANDLWVVGDQGTILHRAS